MALTLLRPEDASTSKWRRIGIYGQNGVGKTTFLASIPLPKLVISADQENTSPLVGSPGTVVAKITNWDDIYTLFYELRDGRLQGKFEVVCFDTVSRCQALAALKVSGIKAPDDPNELAKWLVNPPSGPKGWADWERTGALAADLVRVFNTLPMHTVYLFQEATRGAKFEGDLVETGPALTPAALNVIKAILFTIGRLYVPAADEMLDSQGVLLPSDLRRIDPTQKEVRYLLLGKHPRYFAKGDTVKLGRIIEDPTWEKLNPTLDITPQPQAVAAGG